MQSFEQRAGRFVRCALALLACDPGALQAQEYRPTRPVRILMPNTVGGPHDITARAAVPIFSRIFGQPFLVDNRPAGNGAIASVACAKSEPDGHTICLNSFTNISLNPFLYPNLPYDPPRDFIPVIRLGVLYSALLTVPNLPVNSAKELFDLAKAKPDSLTFSTFGPGSVNNLIIAWAKLDRGAPFYTVPYKVAVQAFNSVLAGETQVGVYAVGVAGPLAKAGKIKALAVMGDRRATAMPDVPTFHEAGIELDLRNWTGIFLPAGTRREIVQRLNQEFGRLLADPAFTQKVMSPSGLEPDDPNSPESFAAFLKKDREMYERLVKAAGIKGD